MKRIFNIYRLSDKVLQIFGEVIRRGLDVLQK